MFRKKNVTSTAILQLKFTENCNDTVAIRRKKDYFTVDNKFMFTLD